MRPLALSWVVPAGFAFLTVCSASLPAGTVEFNRDIRPILSKNCFACHGPDKSHRASKMRLDERASAIARLRGGGAPIVPGKPDASEVMRRVTSHDEAEHMPPPETGNKLTAKQIKTLR